MEKKMYYNQEEGTEKTEFHTPEKWERSNENYMEDNGKDNVEEKKQRTNDL